MSNIGVIYLSKNFSPLFTKHRLWLWWTLTWRSLLHFRVFLATDLSNWSEPSPLQQNPINNQIGVLERENISIQAVMMVKQTAKCTIKHITSVSALRNSCLQGEFLFWEVVLFTRQEALGMLISQSKGFLCSANSYSAVLIMQVRYIAVLLPCNTLQISMHHVHNVWNISKFMLHSSFLWLLVSFSIIFLQQIDSPSKMHKCTLKWITLSRLLLLKSQVPLLLFTRNNCLNCFTFCSASTAYFLHSVSNSKERLNSNAWLSYCSTMER